MFHCFDFLVIQFWVAGNAMLCLRPPGEGERLCTSWFLLRDFKDPGIVALRNFSGFRGSVVGKYVGDDLFKLTRLWVPHEAPFPLWGCSHALFCIVVDGPRPRVREALV